MLTPVQKLILKQTALSNQSNMVLISYCALFGWPPLRGSRHQLCKIRHLLQWPRLDRLTVDMLRIKATYQRFQIQSRFLPAAPPGNAR